MIGQTIPHLPRGIKESGLIDSNLQVLHKEVIFESNKLLSNGVNKIFNNSRPSSTNLRRDRSVMAARRPAHG